MFVNAQFSVHELPDMAPKTKLPNPLEWLTLAAGPADVHALIAELQDVVRAQGPFDGLVGFSQGASVATMLLLEDERTRFAQFKCAILFSTIHLVVNPALLQPESSDTQVPPIYLLDTDVHGQGRIKVPSAHFWATEDSIAGNGPARVADLYDSRNRQVFIHSLGHDIPGSRSEETLQHTALLIDRTIERAKVLEE